MSISPLFGNCSLGLGELAALPIISCYPDFLAVLELWL